MVNIGILALQGAFIEHKMMLNNLSVNSFEIRNAKDLNKPLDGLIIPGGESTVIGKLLRESNMFNPIKKLIDNGLPVFGTCAGMILLAKEIENNNNNLHLATFPISVIRNAYGRQLGSFHTDDLFDNTTIPMTYIRAPYIGHILDNNVEILSITNGNITAARYNNQLVTAFHPELDNNLLVHKYFLDMVIQHKNNIPKTA